MRKQNTAGQPGQPGFGYGWSPCSTPLPPAVEVGLEWAVVQQGGCGLIFDENGLHIATVPNFVYFGEDGKPDGGAMVQRLANLIAAAPKLLKTSREVTKCWSAPKDTGTEGLVRFQMAVEALHAAIVQAEGGATIVQVEGGAA